MRKRPETFLEFLKVNAIEATKRFFEPLTWPRSLWKLIKSRIKNRNPMDNSQVNKLSQKQYIKLLEEHFDFTMRYRKVYWEPEIEPIEKSILDHREKFSVKYPKAIFITSLTYAFTTAVVMGIAILYVINEIIKYQVDYSLSNVLVLSVAFFIGRVRLKFFEN